MNAHQLFEKLTAIPLEQLAGIDLQVRPLEEQVKAFAESSKHVQFLAADVINPLLESMKIFPLSDKEKAVIGCYYRSYGWMVTLATLNDPIHFQAVAGGARALFEIWVDLKILTEDAAGRETDRYHGFPAYERLRAANKIVKYSKDNPSLKIECSHQQAFVSEPSKNQEIEDLVVRLWGKDKKGYPHYPKHWSGKDLAARIPVDATEMQIVYNDHYPLLSWYVHSGSTGYAGLDRDFLKRCFALSHIIAQKASLASIEIVAKETKITKVVSWLPQAIEKTRLAPGLLLMNESILNAQYKLDAVRRGGVRHVESFLMLPRGTAFGLF